MNIRTSSIFLIVLLTSQSYMMGIKVVKFAQFFTRQLRTKNLVPSKISRLKPHINLKQLAKFTRSQPLSTASSQLSLNGESNYIYVTDTYHKKVHDIDDQHITGFARDYVTSVLLAHVIL